MFTNYKQEIFKYLSNFLQEKSSQLSQINPWGKDVINRLLPYLENGKMIRGSLVIFSQNMFGNKNNNNLIIASALELVQAGLLIHDDIIDQDKFRRGQVAIHNQYQQLNNLDNFGNAMGICVGDICFFLLYELLSSLKIEAQIKNRIINIISQEMQCVCLGQMQDVYFSVSKKNPSETDILDLYRTKTGRYSFSLPLMLGAISQKQSPDIIKQLESLGEYLGLIFQIADDQLSLFGDQNTTGKPIGTDIIRANKTLYYHYLYSLSSLQEKEVLNKIFGKSNLQISEIEYVRNLITSLSIDKKIQEKITIYEDRSKTLINKLPIAQNHKNSLSELLEFLGKRKK